MGSNLGYASVIRPQSFFNYEKKKEKKANCFLLKQHVHCASIMNSFPSVFLALRLAEQQY